jgi:uncharacterized protein YciI
MFALIATYTRPAEEVDQHLEGHIAWITRHAEKGRILVTARQVPLEGGLILATNLSRAEVDEMIAEDPFHTSGVATYEVREFEVRRAAPGLEGIVGA